MHRFTRLVLARFALLIAGVLLAGGTAEVILRLRPGLLPEEAQLRIYWDRLVHQEKTTSVPHPYLGFTYPPHYHGEIRRKEVRFSYTTDEHGFRNPSPWPAAADVVAVGDSQTFGWGVDDREAWASLVAAAMPQSDLVNLGLIGAAPQQYFRVFETFGVPLKPKVVLFGLFPGNDLTDASLFADWLNAGAPGNYDTWRFFRGDVRRPLGVLKRSYLLNFVRESVRGLHSPFSGRTLEFPDGGRIRLAPRVRAGSAARATPGDATFQLVLDAVERTRSLAADHGCAFVVLLFPTKEEVYLPLLDEPTPRPIAPFAAELGRRGITYIDLTPPFQEHATRRERLFFEIDGHPNAAGHRLIAAVVLAHLRENCRRYGLGDCDG